MSVKSVPLSETSTVSKIYIKSILAFFPAGWHFSSIRTRTASLFENKMFPETSWQANSGRVLNVPLTEDG